MNVLIKELSTPGHYVMTFNMMQSHKTVPKNRIKGARSKLQGYLKSKGVYGVTCWYENEKWPGSGDIVNYEFLVTDPYSFGRNIRRMIKGYDKNKDVYHV